MMLKSTQAPFGLGSAAGLRYNYVIFLVGPMRKEYILNINKRKVQDYIYLADLLY